MDTCNNYVALTSFRSKQNAKTFDNVSKHFQFYFFKMGKEHKILKNIANFAVGSKCTKAGVQFSSELMYVLQFSQHFKATK